jgi:hypothetical protein
MEKVQHRRQKYPLTLFVEVHHGQRNTHILAKQPEIFLQECNVQARLQCFRTSDSQQMCVEALESCAKQYFMLVCSHASRIALRFCPRMKKNDSRPKQVEPLIP